MGKLAHKVAVVTAASKGTDLIARLWLLDLRRESFTEIGGASPPTDIWRCVRQLIDTNEITAQGHPLRLPHQQASRVRQLAKELAEHVVVRRSGAI